MLYLLRHAQATPYVENDFERALTPQGQKDAQRIGLWLKQRMCRPDLIITSSATRTMQTADIIAQELGYEHDKISGLKSLYLADENQILDLIRTVSSSIHNLLLIGHNPGLQDLSLALCDSKKSRVKMMDLYPASLAMFGEIDAWQNISPGSTTLMGLVHGRYLPKAL